MPNAMPRLGPDSPLLTPSGKRRRVVPLEVSQQIAFMTLCVGPARKGQPRRMGDGMTTRFPELFLLTAINPNKGGARSRAAAGIAKAMGLLPSMPDTWLPVGRGPYLSLLLEFKQDGRYGGPDQRERAEQLRTEGHCVVEVQGCQEALTTTLGYLALPPHDLWMMTFGREHTVGSLLLPQQRAQLYAALRPNRR